MYPNNIMITAAETRRIFTEYGNSLPRNIKLVKLKNPVYIAV